MSMICLCLVLYHYTTNNNKNAIIFAAPGFNIFEYQFVYYVKVLFEAT